MKNLINLILLLIFSNNCFSQGYSYREGSDRGSYGDRQSYSQKEHGYAGKRNGSGGVAVNGLVSGQVVETNNAIILNGATIVRANSDAPLVKVGDTNKKVILNNVRIISSNATDVVLDVGDVGGGVRSRNVSISVNNASISRSGCSAIACLANSGFNISVSVGGSVNFNSGD